MRLSFWDGPNFGDQLNRYIFPKLFPSLFSDPDITPLYGIGSIIDSRIPIDKRAVLFGTGLRNPQIHLADNKWDIRFLRGPLSANFFHPQARYIADGAYLLLLLKDFSSVLSSSKKRYRASLMPYKNHSSSLPWKMACTSLGINFIDPAEEPEVALRQIADSELVIAGAMHAAIAADICRVPWVRLRMNQFPPEPPLLTEFKWADWTSAIAIENSRGISISFERPANLISKRDKVLFFLESYVRLRRINRSNFLLSNDFVIERIKERLTRECESLVGDYSPTTTFRTC